MADSKNLVIKVEVDPNIDLTTVVGGDFVWYNPETDEEEFRPKTLGDLVAEKVANSLMAGMDRNTQTVIVEQVRDARLKSIAEKVDPMVEEALAGPIQLTNAYGERVGKEVTLRELVVTEATKALSKRHTSSREETLLNKVIREQVASVLTKELAESLVEAKKTIVEAVKAKAAEYMTEAVLAPAAKRSAIR